MSKITKIDRIFEQINIGNFILLLITISALLDLILFNDARGSKILFSQARLLPQSFKAIAFGIMIIYVFLRYRIFYREKLH